MDSMEGFFHYLKTRQTLTQKISDLRDIWAHESYGKVLRMISMHFLRAHSYSWIFNSRLEEKMNHLKYKHRLMEGVTKPKEFLYIKLSWSPYYIIYVCRTNVFLHTLLSHTYMPIQTHLTHSKEPFRLQCPVQQPKPSTLCLRNKN